MAKNKNEIEKYQEDLKTIKDILKKTDEILYVEHWAFFTWGVLAFAGTILHYITHNYFGYDIKLAFNRIWLPCFLIAAFFETIAWCIRNNKEKIPYTSKTNRKLIFGGSAYFIGWIFILSLLAKINALSIIPVVMITFFGMFMLLIGQVSYNFLNLCGLFLIVSAVIIYFFQLAVNTQIILGGVLIGLTFIVEGFLAKNKERSNNEQ